MSYTTFDHAVDSSDVKLQAHGTNSISVTVTNTGKVAGKQVVQLYVEAPYDTDDNCGIQGTGLQKSAKVLIGYQKTDLLEPGQSQTVTIKFATDDLASFDTYAGRVAIGELDKLTIFGGDYDAADGTCRHDEHYVVDLAVGHLKALEHAENYKGIRTGFPIQFELSPK